MILILLISSYSVTTCSWHDAWLSRWRLRCSFDFFIFFYSSFSHVLSLMDCVFLLASPVFPRMMFAAVLFSKDTIDRHCFCMGWLGRFAARVWPFPYYGVFLFLSFSLYAFFYSCKSAWEFMCYLIPSVVLYHLIHFPRSPWRSFPLCPISCMLY